MFFTQPYRETANGRMGEWADRRLAFGVWRLLERCLACEAESVGTDRLFYHALTLRFLGLAKESRRYGEQADTPNADTPNA
ncbi:MAG: hypothetical protein WAM44_16425 [Chthoniobacterales bacterium]